MLAEWHSRTAVAGTSTTRRQPASLHVLSDRTAARLRPTSILQLHGWLVWRAHFRQVRPLSPDVAVPLLLARKSVRVHRRITKLQIRLFIKANWLRLQVSVQFERLHTWEWLEHRRRQLDSLAKRRLRQLAVEYEWGGRVWPALPVWWTHHHHSTPWRHHHASARRQLNSSNDARANSASAGSRCSAGVHPVADDAGNGTEHVQHEVIKLAVYSVATIRKNALVYNSV